MPLYTYRCPEGHVREVFHKVGEALADVCSTCGGPLTRYVTGGSGSFVRGITTGKYYKEDRLRKKKNADMEVRQFERYGGANKLVPNIEGQEVSSWKEAESLARSQGLKDASKFRKYQEDEAQSKNSASLNEKRLAALREKARNIH